MAFKCIKLIDAIQTNLGIESKVDEKLIHQLEMVLNYSVFTP